MRRYLNIFMVMILMFGVSYFPVHADNHLVTPDAEHYAVTGTKITGLKADYFNTLTADERQNINLVLPDQVNDILITEIADSAFKQTTDRRYVGLDMSNMKHLITIGQQAFYNNVALTGDLVIPDSVVSIGYRSFYGCSALKGNLRLPSKLEIINNDAFQNTGFTGELVLPYGLTSIGSNAFRQSNSYQGFTGTIVIPDSVTSVGKTTFYYQAGITGAVLSKNMTAIPESMFRDCRNLTGTIIIPENIQSIGNNAFTSTSIKTVYLPKMANQSSTDFILGRPFYDCSKLTAIVTAPEDYSLAKNLSSDSKAKFTYEVTIQLKDKQGNDLPQQLKKLYGFAYNYVLQADQSWIQDTTYQFPSVKVDETVYKDWGLNKNSNGPVFTTTLVGFEKALYPVESRENPVITYSDGIDKVYDGKASTLQVTATHPKAVPIEEAGDGDVVFYYIWAWGMIGNDPNPVEDFDLNTYEVSDVREPRFTIGLSVQIKACLVEGNEAKPFYTETHDFPILLKQAEPTVTPSYKKKVEVKDGLPSLSLSTGDTKGSIVWDSGQTLQAGTHTYKWTFTPSKNDVGNSNYTVVHGTAEITGWVRSIYQMQIVNHGNGTITPNNATNVTQGDDFTCMITPNPGYELSRLAVDGVDVTMQVKANQYTIKDVQEHHKIEVTFKQKSAGELENILDKLPKPDETKPFTKEEVNSILKAKLEFAGASETDTEISRESKDQLNDLLASLPQVKLPANTNLVNSHTLLDNMSKEDVALLLADPDATVQIDCAVEATKPSTQDSALIMNAVPQAEILDCFEINVTKAIHTSDTDTVNKLKELSAPIQLTFDIPSNTPPIQAGYTREYFMVRLHQDGANQQVEVLKNESKDGSSLVISSDKFSLYAIAYKDVETPTIPPDIDIPPTIHIPSYDFGNGLKDLHIDFSWMKTSVDTSDHTVTTFWYVLGSSAMLVAFIVFKKLD